MIDKDPALSDPCSFTTDFGDGAYKFRPNLSELEELEEKCGAGIGAIYLRLHSPNYTIADVRETVRLGLIGGGMAPGKALALVRRYVDGRPIDESWLLARTIMGAVMHGVANDSAPSVVPPRAEGANPTEVSSDEPPPHPAPVSAVKSRFSDR